MSIKYKIFLSCLLLIITASKALTSQNSSNHNSGGTLITVGTDIDCDHDTIQAAIDAAPNTGSTEIRITNQQEWNERLVFNNIQKISVNGGFSNCTSNQMSGVRSVINATSSTQQPGIYVYRSEEIYFRRLEVKNASGGGVLISQSKGATFGSIYLFDMKLKNNSRLSASGALNGGGLAVIRSSRVYVDGSTLQNNTAANGGGVYCESSELSIQNPDIINNQTLSVVNDPSYGKGGGIYASNSCQLLLKTFLSSTSNFGQGIKGNTASFKGGGLFADGQSHVQINQANAFFQVPLTFINNKIIYAGSLALSGGGGGIAAESFGTEVIAHRLILDNNSIESNSSHTGGAALHLSLNASFSLKTDESTQPCRHILANDNDYCNQIINNHSNQRAAMVYMHQGASAEISQSYVSGNSANLNQLGSILEGDLIMQGNIFTANGISNNATPTELFFVYSLGTLQIDFSTFKANYLQGSYVIRSFQSDQIELTRSIIDEANDALVFFDDSGSGQSITTFRCLLTHEDNSFTGQIITVGSPAYQPNWPFHLSENSLAVDMCQLNQSTSEPEVDLDGDIRGFCRGPSCASNPQRFDAGADEYRITDLIFADGFD